jgi:excisionase family DNA binding protein
MGNFSFELRTYDPCEVLVWASRADQHQRVPLAESQASPRRLLPRDQPFRLAIVRRNEFAQRAYLQQEIAAHEQELAACRHSLDEGDQEHIESLKQMLEALYSRLAHWEARYQQQAQARQNLNQQMADLQTQIAHLSHRANQASDPATAMELRNEYRALVKQHDALRQQREQDGGGQAITVCVGVGGLSQTDRDAWKTYAQLEPDPEDRHGTRMLRSTVVRTVPYVRRLFDAGWQLLWLPERPGRHAQVIADIMAHIVIYLWQKEMVEREIIAPWFQDYIRSVCGAIIQADVDYVLEVVLKDFALPLHANSLHAFIKDTLYQQRRQGDPDKRLVRGVEESVSVPDTHPDARTSARRRTIPQRVALTVRDAASQLGCSEDTVHHLIRDKKLKATRKGKYWQLSPVDLDREKRKRLQHALKNELIRLRVRWRSGGYAALRIENAASRAWDAARKWIEDQRKQQKTPGEVFALIAAAPAIQKLLQQEPDLLKDARELLEQLGPDVAWQ